MTTLTNPDETTTPAPNGAGGLVEQVPRAWPTVDPFSAPDALSALQVGLAVMLSKVDFWSVDMQSLFENGATKKRKFRFDRIRLDWADENDELAGHIPSAAIVASDDLTYQDDNFSAVIDDDTDDVFGEGTVLRRVGHLSTVLEVKIWLANKDDRAGVRKGLEEAFLAEPSTEGSGRMIKVSQYYDQTARYLLRRMTMPDGEQNARSKQWIVNAFFQSDIQVVSLVRKPPYVRVEHFEPDLDSEIE